MKRRILSTLLAFIMTLSLLPGTALAANSGTCGKSAKWTINSAGVLTISGSGNMNEYYDQTTTPWYSQRGNITAVVVNGVNKVGIGSFRGCPSLKKVTIGNGVTMVGADSFQGCANLESVSFSSSVTCIDDKAFQGCVSLASATIPGTVSTLGKAVFADCSSLRSVTLKPGTTNIGREAFMNCTSLTSVKIPVGMTSLADDAFKNCVALKTLTLPQGLTEIGQGTFLGCKSLTSVKFPTTLTSIGWGAFSGCSGLKSLTIPGNVSDIWIAAFQNCTGLTSLIISDGVQRISSEAFAGCVNLKSVTIPRVSDLGSSAFAGCNNLTSVIVKDGVPYLPANIFRDCNNLKTVYLPTSIGSIAGLAFFNCDALTDVHYAGTKAQWDKILIDGLGENESNDHLRRAAKHFNSKPSVTETYTVTFNPNGGKVSPTSKEYKANAALGTLPTPTRTGYKFSGWYTAKTGGTKVSTTKKVTSDMTLYAQWTKNATTTKVTIKLDANGGKVSPSSVSVTKNAAYLSLLPTPTKTGYKFTGWYTSKTGGTKITSTTKAAAGRTVYAHWTKAAADEELTLLKVTFNANGGTVNQRTKQVIPTARYKELPVPFRSGYTFDGWYTAKTGGTKITEKSRVTTTKDQTLYAHWSTKAVTVKKNQTGFWTVSIPARCKTALYSSSTANMADSILTAASAFREVDCMNRVELSNGTVRFYGRFDGGVKKWFTYSCEMDIDS